jgi:hypothetical protein
MDKEQAEKYEQQVSLEYKNRKKKVEERKKGLCQKAQKALLMPPIKNNIIQWVNKLNKDIVYEGFFKNEKFFEIHRGIIVFSLRVVNKNIVYEKKLMTSTKIEKLQKIANEILLKNINSLGKFKPIS